MKQPKTKRGRPTLPAEQKGSVVSIYLVPEQKDICLRFGDTVQDGLREVIRLAGQKKGRKFKPSTF